MTRPASSATTSPVPELPDVRTSRMPGSHAQVTRGTVSLERRLPLLMTGLLAGGMAMLLVITYGTLEQRAGATVSDRLAHAARELASTSELAIAQRSVELRAVAQAPAVRAALGPAPSAATDSSARAALASLLTPRDSLVPVELWDRQGRLVTYAGPRLDEGVRPPVPTLPAVMEERGDPITLSPLERAGRHTRFWTLVPVRDDRNALLGFLAQPRLVIGRRDVTRSIRELTGEQVTLYSHNRDGTVWTTAPGDPEGPTVARDTTEGGVWATRPGVGRVLVADADVRGTPWTVTLETPEAWVHASPHRTITSLALIALLVTAIGGALSWLVSRRITQPITSLMEAAEELARGTYEHPVAPMRRDEIGRLTTSFDVMARQVVTAREELQRRADDAQAAADALERTNQRLQLTTDEAERARAEADRANRAKSDFLAMMSHELRTPLNAIGGYAELMDMGIHGPVTDTQRDALARIGRSQAHLLTLINDVLTFARIDAGQAHYAMADVPLHEALVGLEALVAPQVRARGLTLEYQPCDPALLVRADPDKLRQLVLNLLGNAIKYTPAGRVSLTCATDATHVRIHVRDTGVGIPADRLPRIFEAFVQGERALNRPNDGVGLGLAISRELTVGMGGTLDVESAVGVGSTFTITLARGGGVASPVTMREPSRAQATSV